MSPSNGTDTPSLRARLLRALVELHLLGEGTLHFPINVYVRDGADNITHVRITAPTTPRPVNTPGLTPQQRHILEVAPARAAAVPRKKLAHTAGMECTSYFHELVRQLIDMDLLRETGDKRVYRVAGTATTSA